MSEQSTYERTQVVGIINSLLGKIQSKPIEETAESLATELRELKSSINNLHAQLREANIDHPGGIQIPDAASELDAVVDATETATNTIMESCEAILADTKDIDPNIFQKVEAKIVKIFEACSFQDITGQRIKKVMACLKEVDEKTSTILQMINDQNEEIVPANTSNTSSDENLMNGPALPSNAVTQDDIDKLLAEFDDVESA